MVKKLKCTCQGGYHTTPKAVNRCRSARNPNNGISQRPSLAEPSLPVVENSLLELRSREVNREEVVDSVIAHHGIERHLMASERAQRTGIQRFQEEFCQSLALQEQRRSSKAHIRLTSLHNRILYSLCRMYGSTARNGEFLEEEAIMFVEKYLEHNDLGRLVGLSEGWNAVQDFFRTFSTKTSLIHACETYEVEEMAKQMQEPTTVYETLRQKCWQAWMGLFQGTKKEYRDQQKAFNTIFLFESTSRYRSFEDNQRFYQRSKLVERHSKQWGAIRVLTRPFNEDMKIRFAGAGKLIKGSVQQLRAKIERQLQEANEEAKKAQLTLNRSHSDYFRRRTVECTPFELILRRLSFQQQELVREAFDAIRGPIVKIEEPERPLYDSSGHRVLQIACSSRKINKRLKRLGF